MVKKLIYVLAVIAIVLGTYGFIVRLFVGEREANYGSYVTWGLWVATYLFFAGVASGSYMVATLDYLFGIPLFRGTGKYALWGAMVTLPAALILIGLDLGHLERVWKVYLQPNFNSLLAQMVWGYTIFGVVILVSLWMVMRSSRKATLKGFMALGLVVAVFVSGGVGALLGVNASRAIWHAGLLPAQFPLYSLATGFALLLTVLAIFGSNDDPQRARQLRAISLILVILLLAKSYILWSDISTALYSKVPQSISAINQVLYGTYWWAFWILQLVLGTFIPLIVLLSPKLSQHSTWAGIVGVLVLIGFAAARANIIFPALTVPELEGLQNAFTGPHLSFDYFPSPVEWSVTVGVVGLATLAFLIGTDVLPLFKQKSEARQ